MESIISNLLARFEKGSLNRRELVRGLAMLAASGTAAAAQEEIDFKSADIDHVSIHIADLQRSVATVRSRIDDQIPVALRDVEREVGR